MRGLLCGLLTIAGCATAPIQTPHGTTAVPAGPSWSGSSLDARSAAVESLYETHGPAATDPIRRIKDEAPRKATDIEAFVMMTTPVTQAEYHAYTKQSGTSEPWVDEGRWDGYATGYEYGFAQKFMWTQGAPSEGRRHHPVVLVDRGDAEDYCRWWGVQRGGRGQLPTEAQWSRAASGDAGATFPWGERFDERLANTWESGVGDTSPVDGHAGAQSPFGVADLAGNVFEWTRTSTRTGFSVVKGGSWNAPLAEARASARHERPNDLRHIAVGFRCVYEPVSARERRAATRSARRSSRR